VWGQRAQRGVWGEADLKPHRVKYWLNNERAQEPEVFDARVKTVCEQYAAAQQLHADGVHLVSCDEKTGIQALELVHPTLGMNPGLVQRPESEYKA